ncbi:Pyruvate decarboxylase isozyme [Lachnellula suecica]|uniref:Pyruvate decarboxylase n=1 Tax=Lachnellula suecica TaxID=602035 RepID=A0A8T9BT41_9HELO|nr:Pyruvate decarboxylase isozyme [Lachnellula suecica]
MDTGTSQFGIPDAVFPDVTFNIQGYFTSLGPSLLMMFGGAMAIREMGGKRRVLLVVGDGALQLGIQELGTIIKETLDVIMRVHYTRSFGYTIERALLKPSRAYHEIPSYNYKHMLPCFGHESSNLTRVGTKAEFEAAVASKSYTSPTPIQLMDHMDLPWRIKEMVKNRPRA